MNKYLIIGGIHGNEPLGIEVCKKLKNLKIPYIDVCFANKKAIKQNKRFIDRDLNRVFPGKEKGLYEEIRAKRIFEKCKSYDFVIDFHNTHCPENDCGFVGGANYENGVKLASFLDLKKVIVADYDCINKYVKNCVSVEISVSSKKFNSDYWVKKIIDLKNFNTKKKYRKIQLYTFVYRITREQQNIYKFPNWKAFKKIQSENLKKIDLVGNYYPIFINDTYTPYNYAGLIQKLI